MNFKPLEVHALLSDYGVRPKKGLGQNFLIDEIYLEKIAQAAKINKKIDVLEIGAGIGNLTRHLAAGARKVTAVEIDNQLIPILKKVTRGFENVRIVRGNMLELSVEKVMNSPGYVVAANIPYYITSALIRYLLESPLKPRSVLLTIQQEVAKRVCAKAGALSLLALSVQVYGAPRIVFRIPKEAFYPAPKVDSAVLAIDLYDKPLIAPEKLNIFFRLVKAAFAQKRKMLHNTLAGALGLSKEKAEQMLSETEIDSKRRAQALTIEEWERLTDAYFAMRRN
ncbi:MAG: ribosomal RNA small subunit methyltransferase A [Anaerolineaceae bacterium]|nr:ribosomal RNA small subunit methyltransferase A [Anaerolineaceae bacterium]